MAAEREDRPSLVKMWPTWLATVFSLITSWSAIWRFVLPLATRAEHFQLAGRQAARALVGARGQGGDGRRVGDGSERIEGCSGGVELHVGAVGVTQGAAGERDLHSRSGRLVGRLELVPPAPCLAEGDERAARVVGGEEHHAGRVGGEGVEVRLAQVGGDRRELALPPLGRPRRRRRRARSRRRGRGAWLG